MSHLTVAQAAPAPAPDEVASWLRHAGWTLSASDDAWAVFEADRFGERVAVELPQRAAAPDYPRVLEMLLTDLARLERRRPGELLHDIHASNVDIVRLAIEGPELRDGRMPVEAARRVYGACRDSLLAAACAALGPRPAYGTRKADRAMALLQQARFGQSEVGSFVVNLEVPVPPRLDAPLFDDGDPKAPFERRTTLLLANALATAEVATRRSAASGSLQPFTESADRGVSANLCDAVSELLEAANADAVRASFSFAHRRPLFGTSPRPVTFSADMAPTLRSAASGLREVAVLAGQEVVGTVIKLESEDPTAGGAIQLRVIVEGRSMSVRLLLGPADYAIAAEAHTSLKFVRCVGDLVREGRGRALQSVRDLALVGEEEEG